jgi:hypothetical protein
MEVNKIISFTAVALFEQARARKNAETNRRK